jgi:hypothetical protein
VDIEILDKMRKALIKKTVLELRLEQKGKQLCRLPGKSIQAEGRTRATP